MALPVKMFPDDEEEIKGAVSGLIRWRKNVPEGISFPETEMDTFVLDSGNLSTPGGTGKTLIGRKLCQSHRRFSRRG